MASAEEIRKKNLQESNEALAKAINLTSQLADVMKDVVSSTSNRGELDKSSLDLSRQAVQVTRSLKGEYDSIGAVQKDIAKNQSKSQDIQRQILAVQQNLSGTEKKSLDLFKKRNESLKTAEGKFKALVEGQKQGLKISDDEVKRAKELVDKKSVQLDQASQNLSLQAEQVVNLEQQQAALEENNAYLEEQAQRLSNINKAQGVFGRSLGLASNLLGKIGLGSTFVGKAFSTVSEKTKEFAIQATDGGKKSLGAFGKMKVAAKGFGAALSSSLGPIGLIALAINEIVKAFKKGEEASKRLSEENTGLARTLGVSQTTANQLSGDIRSIGAEMGITGGAAIQAAGSIYSALDGSEKLSRNTLATFTKLTKFAGFTADDVANIQKFSKLAGKEGAVVAEEMATTARESIKANKLNVSMRGLMQAVGKQSAIVKLNTKGSAQELVKQVSQAKALGLEMSKVEDIANGLLDIEQSLAAEMEAELLTGKDLNLEKAREAALNNDNATLMEEIKNQFGSIEEFQSMNRVQQDAFAKAIGQSREGLAEMLVTSKENEAANTDMVDTQQESLKAMQSMASVSERLAAAEEARANRFAGIFNALSPIVELFKDLGPLVLKVITPIVEKLAPILMKIANKLLPVVERMFGALVPIIDSILVAIEPLLDVFFEIQSVVGEGIAVILEELSPIISEIFKALSPIIELFSSLVKAILPALVAGFKVFMRVLDPVMNVIKGIGKVISGIFSGDFGAVADGLKSIAQGLINFIIASFESLINAPIAAINALLSYIPGVGKNAISEVEFGRIELAEGGIVTGPTNALIGEAGPEAVVPLNGDKSMNIQSKAIEEKLDALIAIVQQGGDVFLDGNKVGNTLALSTYRMQ